MPSEELPLIRNVALIGQGGVGKTTAGDALLYAAGAVDRPGSVAEGTSHFDVEPEEQIHQVSITAAIHHASWRRHDITIVDTPGQANFLAETELALRAVDGAVMVLPASGQIKVETQRVWDWAGENGLACVGFVGHLDKDSVDVDALLEQLGTILGVRHVPLGLPVGEGETLEGFVDLLSRRFLRFDEDGKVSEAETPSGMEAAVEASREKLVEAVAEGSDELLERYLEAGELSDEDVRTGLRAGVLSRSFVPVVFGSATRGVGIAQLLDLVVDALPSPADRSPANGTDPRTGEPVERIPSDDAPASAFVFKTVIDPFAGKLSVFRVVSGTVSSDHPLLNASRDGKERIGHLLRLEGKGQSPLDAARTGRIAAVAKLKDTHTGDTLSDEKEPVFYPGKPEHPPSISFAIEPKSRADEEKAAQGLHRLLEEDPALRFDRDEQTREMILSGAGQQHVEIVVERLRRKYNVEVELKSPKVPYRETIRGRGKAQGKYKKQSGGRGQYGDAWIEIEPLPRGSGFEFVDKIVGGVIPRQFIPAVEKGIREAMAQGIVAGYPMQDVRVTLVDGSHHSVDSSEMAFKIAGSMAFKNAVDQAHAVLLEPIMKMSITTPEDSMGDVIGDLNSRRGKVSGMDTGPGGEQVISALVPMSEVLRYDAELRSMTSGRGSFIVTLSHYDEVPAALAGKIVEASRKSAE